MGSRSLKKGVFVSPCLLRKVAKVAKFDSKPIKTWARRSTILEEHVGLVFLVHNGKKFIPVSVVEDMVGHKLGEFSFTRVINRSVSADKKIKKG